MNMNISGISAYFFLNSQLAVNKHLLNTSRFQINKKIKAISSSKSYKKKGFNRIYRRLVWL